MFTADVDNAESEVTFKAVQIKIHYKLQTLLVHKVINKMTNNGQENYKFVNFY